MFNAKICLQLLPDDGFEKQGLVYVQHSCPFILAIKNDDVRIVKLLISCDKNNVVSRMVTEKSLFTPLMYFVLDHNFSMDVSKYIPAYYLPYNLSY